MSNYVEKIKVGTGAAWPVRDAEAHELLNDLAGTVNDLSSTVDELAIAKSKNLDELDGITVPGWYIFNDTIMFPGHEFDGFGMRVDAIASSSVVQTLFPYSTHVTELKRHKEVDGAWSEWEWVNPPMMLGVEYRTTERILGKPVYRKAVELGDLEFEGENSWEYFSDFDIQGLTGCIDVDVLSGDNHCITHDTMYIRRLFAGPDDLTIELTSSCPDDPIVGAKAVLTYVK